MNKPHIKCIVNKCENHMDEGCFMGTMCGPCAIFAKTGKSYNSQLAWNQEPDLDEDLFITLSEMQSI
jgi:hypothetical protein